MPYYGASITRDDSWSLEIARVPQSMREEESALQETCWFDYRHLQPAQATYLFANRYQDIGKEIYSQTQDYRNAETINMLSCEDIFESPELLSFWRARQSADRLGCKYDFFIRYVFKRFWNRGSRFFPRPNQLYAEDVELDIKDAWNEEKLTSLQLSSVDRYKNSSYVGHPDQVAYHSYLVEQIKQREHPQMALCRVMLKERVLPLEVAGEHFEAELIRKAMSLQSH